MIKIKNFLVLLTLYISLSISKIFAWDDCPKGLVDDPYPGKCGLYTDTNNDEICDHSQKEPLANSSIGGKTKITPKPSPIAITSNTIEENHDEDYSVEIEGQAIKALTIQEIADLWQINSNTLLNQIISKFNLKEDYATNSIIDDLRTEYKFSPAQIKEIAEEIKSGNSIENISQPTEKKTTPQSKNPYNILIPAIITSFLYYFFYQKNKTKNLLKFNFWTNTALLVSTIPSIIFGLFLILRYSFPSLYNLKFNFLYWHVEGSIVFTTLIICHFIQRFNQYKIQTKSK